MKTPKRYIEIAPFDITEMVYPPHPEHVLEQRFKCKNRIAQLKRTIARLVKEREQVKSEAYHKGHYDGYQACFARLMF